MEVPETYLSGRKAWPSETLLKPEDIWKSSQEQNRVEASGPILQTKAIEATDMLDPISISGKHSTVVNALVLQTEENFQEKDNLENEFKDNLESKGSFKERVQSRFVQWNASNREITITVGIELLGWILFALTALFALWQMWTLSARLYALEASLKLH